MELPVFDAEHANLEDYRVGNVPKTVYLIPDFVNDEEEEYLLRKVNEAPKPRWTQLSNRRLQNWGGHPHAKGMIPESLPTWLEIYAKKIGQLGIFGDRVPNHVLVNEYNPGQGIMPHVDGPVFFPTITTLNLGSHTILDYYHAHPPTGPTSDSIPTFDNIIQVDLDETAAKTRSLQHRHAFSLFLPPKSLLIQRDEMYTDYLHGIKEVKTDVIDDKVVNREECRLKVGDVISRGVRVSLTVRLVQKTAKFKLNFGAT